LKNEIQRRVSDKSSFETADWLNVILYEVLCTSKSRKLVNSDQEALLSALTKISREAIEAKLSDYQKESWLFLSSLDLESFSFGDRLPIIERVRIASKPSSNSISLVLDVSYTGGIKVGLKASMAMNFRDFASVINFNSPSKFKIVLKLDGDPMPRVSLMLTDLPSYEMVVSMKSQQLERASNLFKLLIEKFSRSRFCYPNYMTMIFRPQDHKKFLQIATAKQYQSQLRVRLVSINLNPDHPGLFSPELNVIAALNLGEITCKTEVIDATQSNLRWNSIHSFNIFNGLEDSPQILKISLYQVLDSSTSLASSYSSSSQESVGLGRSLNHLGRIEVPYSSITPGILDIRTLSLTTDENSTVSIEMYLHHMEEDGEADSSWIFWNEAKPKKIPQSSELDDKSLEELNWQSIKFVISKLSYDDPNISHEYEELESETTYEIEEFNDASSVISLPNLKIEPENLLETLQNRLDSIISSAEILSEIAVEPLHVLKALKFEMTDFISRFHLNRPALSVQALPAHNARLLDLLKPLMKQFMPEALSQLNSISLNHPDAIGVTSMCQEMNSYINGEAFSTDLRFEPSSIEKSESTVLEKTVDIKAHLGDLPVKVFIDVESGISIERMNSESQRIPFDSEGVLYSVKSLKTVNLASSEFSDSISTTWEIVLLKDRFLTFVPLGESPIFPQRVLDASELRHIELIRDRNAFTIGFNANLSSQEAFQHANNGMLRLYLDCGEVIDLLGESRSCDQWYCLLSARILSEPTIDLKWDELASVWLLPLNLPALAQPHAIALKTTNNLVLLLTDCDQLYFTYCLLRKTCKAFNDRRDEKSLLSTPNSSVNSSPQSKKSSIFTFSKRSLASSASSTSHKSKDPFASKSRYDRLVMTRNLCPPTQNFTQRLLSSSSSLSVAASSSSMLKMDSIDSLLLSSTANNSNWASILSENSFKFSCTLTDFPSGYLFIGPEFICYCAMRATSVPLSKPSKQANILLLPRSYVQNVSKSSPNWMSSFSGIVIKTNREVFSDLLLFTAFESVQEMNLAFDSLLEIY
jgi:hypothetical protein